MELEEPKKAESAPVVKPHPEYSTDGAEIAFADTMS